MLGCGFLFDGKCGTLARAYFSENDGYREIHFEKDENWYFGFDGHATEDQMLFE